MPTPFAKLAGAVMLATTTLAPASAEAQAASSSPPVVAIVEIQAPWYAPDFVIRHKMRETIPEYAALPGLLFKYFSIAQGDKFGGIYLWRDAASAHAWFSPAWFDTVLRTRGAPAHVRFFEVLQAADFTSGGVGRDAHSHDAATLLITSATDGTLPTASSQAGLLRRYSVRSEDGKLAWIDLWSSKAAAQAFFNPSELARLQQTMGAMQIEYFKIPIVLPSTLPENQQGDAS
jgi:hypothetical protein